MLAAVLAIAAAPSNLPITVDGALCHPTHLLVKLKDMGDTSGVEGAGLRVLETYPQINLAVVDTPLGTLKQAKSSIQRMAGVERVEYDYAGKPAYEPNDELWPDMWHAKTIKADLAWDLSKGSNSIIVAVIDTGVNYDHPDLVANIWTNTNEIAGDGIDNDGNGYVDDVHGYDFGYGDGDPNDVHGHGSACSGLVAAVQDNTIGVTGVAPKARIMCMKAAIDSGYFYDSANIGAYLYAQAMGAKVFSCSFFSDRVSQAERDAIDYCWNHGVVPVVAAGNDNTVYSFYPGAYENVIGVAATDESNNKAGFSDYGAWVDVACPGVNLRTTTNSGDYTAGFGGTSGATPQVAGLCALIWGAHPTLTNAQVRSIVEDTSTQLSWDFSNYGLINCQMAMRVAMGLSQQPTKSPIVRYMTPLIVGPKIGFGSTTGTTVRIYGRGFQAPNVIRVEVGGVAIPVLAQSRNWVDVRMPIGKGTVTVFVNNVLRKTVIRPNVPATVWPLIEVASQGGGATTGGFVEGINSDGAFVTCTRRSDGFVQMDATFRKVTSFGNPMKLFIRRHYTGSTVGTEKIFAYDWSSASYPYGSFVLVHSEPLPQAPEISTITINQPWKFIDPEGTMYFRFSTSSDVNSNVKLNLDQAQLRDR